jgi:hypothetical protein
MKALAAVCLLASCGFQPVVEFPADGGAPCAAPEVVACEVLEVSVAYCVGRCAQLECQVTFIAMTNLDLASLQRAHPECSTKLRGEAYVFDCRQTSTIPLGARTDKCGWLPTAGVCR